jgi:hypothetical protein
VGQNKIVRIQLMKTLLIYAPLFSTILKFVNYGTFSNEKQHENHHKHS